MSELQRIADSLAHSTRLAVAIHDRNRNLLAYSAHQGQVDEIRKASILTRRGPANTFNWARSFGIEEATEPVRIPANPELGMGPRICAPIRFEERLLGFLWLTDPGGPIDPGVLRLVTGAADAAALGIHHEELVHELERGRERELVRDLLSDQEELRAHAVEQLVELNLVIPMDTVVVYVVKPVREREGMTRTDSSLRINIERALTQARHTVPPRQALQLVRPDHGVLVASFRTTVGSSAVDQLGRDLQKALGDVLGPDRPWKAVVGIGDRRRGLGEAQKSYRHARLAADVTTQVHSFGPVTSWNQLGVYQTLLELPLGALTEEALPPGLVRLFGVRDSDVWVRTLEVYLDEGCDARSAAGLLHLNRGSLYHRLHRIESLAGVDLTRGDDRLALHLGLKLARLAGMLDAKGRRVERRTDPAIPPLEPAPA